MNDRFFEAVKAGDLATVNTLLDEGVDIHHWNDFALHNAAEHGHLDVVNRLLEANANVHAANNWSLHWAASNKHLDVVTCLLEYGATYDPEWENIPENIRQFCLSNQQLGPKSATKLS